MFRVLIFTLLFATCFGERPQTPAKAFDLLMEGNRRFASGKPKEANRNLQKRKAKVEWQKPYAVIVACSDSRVSPEIVFDSALGELFVVRVAGNVVSDVGLESINYGVHHLGSLIILVMGHQNCGAVDAVLNKQSQDIPAIAKLIEPAIAKARQEKTANALETVIKLNALDMKKYLMTTPVIKSLLEEKKIEIRAAYYNFATGKVEILDN